MVDWFALNHIGLGEANLDQEQEHWMNELIGYDRWVKHPLYMFMDMDCAYEYEIDMWVKSFAIYVYMCWQWDVDLWVKLQSYMLADIDC